MKILGTDNEEFIITGVDEYGYLRVTNAEGKEIVLHPNGNSIDMLAGLVIPRDQPQ